MRRDTYCLSSGSLAGVEQRAIPRFSAQGVVNLDSPIKILVISHCFPPDIQVGGWRVAEFCRYLPEFGVQPFVLTIEDRFRESIDNSFSLPPGIRVERTTVDPTRVDWYRRAKSFFGAGGNIRQPQKPSSVTPASKGLLRRNLITLLQYPGPDSGWYRPAIRAAERLIREESIAGIFSSSPPVVAHRIALHLKQKFNLPWLADFRDPWAAHRAATTPAWWRRVNQRMESRCVRSAERVICNTESAPAGFSAILPGTPAAKVRYDNQWITWISRQAVPSHAPEGRFYCSTLAKFTACAA